MVTITELSCRVCLQEQEIMINIYDELEDLQTNLSNLLETCGDLQVDENDIFPKYLCEDCTRELLISSKFREKCCKSKEVLNEILQQNRETEIRETDIKETENLNNVEEYYVEELNNMIDVSDVIIEESHTIEETEQCQIPKENTEDDHILTSNEIVMPFQWEATNRMKTNEVFVAEIEAALDSTITVDDSCLPSGETNEPLAYTPINNEERKDLLYKCDICGVIYKQAINLQKHLCKMHAPLKVFSCEKCGHWFSTETQFNTHVQCCNYYQTTEDNTETNKKKKIDKIISQDIEQDSNRKCVYCEKQFPTPFALRMHIRTHTGERPFQCKYCFKSFKTQSALNVHNKRHTGQADYVCTVCNKTFYEQGNLTVHMRSHTGERPHVCTICNKTFTRVFLLQLHMRTHTGETPFNCPYCDKSFKQTTDLRCHLTIHTGHKQYSCPICSKAFSKRSPMLQHMQKHSVLAVEDDNNDIVHNEQITEEITNASIYSNSQDSEVLYSFDDIIESEDVVLQSDIS